MVNINLDALIRVVHLLPKQHNLPEFSTDIKEAFDTAVKDSNLPVGEFSNNTTTKCVGKRDYQLALVKVQGSAGAYATLTLFTPDYSIDLITTPQPNDLWVLWNGNSLNRVSYPNTWDSGIITYLIKDPEQKQIAQTIIDAAKDVLLGRSTLK